MDHIFLKGVTLQKECHNGNWMIVQIETNIGTFAIGNAINEELDQVQVTTLMQHLRDVIMPELDQFLDTETTQKTEATKTE